MKRPWMPLWVGDYLSATSHLDAEEHGAYLLLIMHGWSGDGRIKDSPPHLARVARVPLARWKSKVWPALQGFFREEDGFLIQKRLSKEIEKSEGISEKRAAAAAARHGRKSANVEHANASSKGMQNACKTHANASSKGMQNACKTRVISQSHSQSESEKYSPPPTPPPGGRAPTKRSATRVREEAPPSPPPEPPPPPAPEPEQPRAGLRPRRPAGMTDEMVIEFERFFALCKPVNHFSTMQAYLRLRRDGVPAEQLYNAAAGVAAVVPQAYRSSPDRWLKEGDWRLPPPQPARARPATRYEEGLAFLATQKRALAAMADEDPGGIVIDGACEPQPTWSDNR